MAMDPAPFRILLVDDSSVVRRVLTSVISSDPRLEIAGTASNGRIALERIRQLRPDLVVLDVEMPEMDGLATLAELRKTDRRLPVIMFSTLTQRGATATLDALALGADDYVPKERNTLGLAAAIDDIRQDLLPKIHALCERRTGRRLMQQPVVKIATAPKLTEKPLSILAIGVSTGGPEALGKVLPEFAADLPVPVVIVQHMPPLFTKILAERLTTKCAMPVKEASGGELLTPGTIWLAPGGRHMQVAGNEAGATLRLDDSDPVNFCRPSVDVLFHSVVRIYGPGTLAVVLTGMGCDGLRACHAIRAAGGQIVAQDEESSVVWGMPGAIFHAGITDSVLPLREVAKEITRRVLSLRPVARPYHGIARSREDAYVQQSK